MRTILSLRGHRYLRTVGSLLIVIALVAGIASCGPVEKYELTMAVAPAGGGNAADETGTSPYREGTVVDITAVAADCYRFVSWTAPDGTFGNATAAETTFTMPAQNVTVTANFEFTPLDHFKFYELDTFEEQPDPNKEVTLVDEFCTVDAVVRWARYFGNPVEKVHNDVVTPISDPDSHFTVYELDYYPYLLGSYRVVVKNQFGNNQELTVVGPYYLAVPTQKEGHEEPICLDHFLLYLVTDYETVPSANVHLEDQFNEEDVDVEIPKFFANPVQKTVDGEVTEIMKETQHLVFYQAYGEFVGKQVQIENQFGPQTLDVDWTEMLAVPSEIISWEQPLDHFKVYPAFGSTVNENVQLVDQFVSINATVGTIWGFANPASKFYNLEWTYPGNKNNHLTFYWLSYEGGEGAWDVTVDNQFGTSQHLLVGNPQFLAVPTQKEDLGQPMGLDHFLCYQVGEYDTVPSVDVKLEDQWIPALETDTVAEPLLFAVPVQKTHAGNVTEIMNPDEHLVFYMIGGGTFTITDVPIANQFGQWYIDAYQGPTFNLLGVPSEKVHWSVYTP